MTSRVATEPAARAFRYEDTGSRIVLRTKPRYARPQCCWPNSGGVEVSAGEVIAVGHNHLTSLDALQWIGPYPAYHLRSTVAG